MFHVKRHDEEIEKIVSQAAAWGLEVPPERASRLVDYAEYLASYTESNVIGTRRVEDIIEEHILDSTSCVLFEPSKDATELVDVGSGGGLPGLPLAIGMEGLSVTLVESTAKKTKFLDDVVEHLGVSNCQVVNARAEDLGHSEEFRSRYDIATARALASLDVIAEYCVPLVRIGGHVIAMKAGVGKNELDNGRISARLLGGEIVDVIPVERLPEYEPKQRSLIVFEKVARTSKKYPRQVGLPAKKPLGGIGKQ